MQLPHVGKHFAELFKSMDVLPDTIIELGTYDGEFSSIIFNLRSQYNDNFNFITYDHHYHLNLVDYRKNLSVHKNFEFKIQDIFASLDEIGDIISKSGKCLVLCDNGKKIDEVNALCKYLKVGDIIMAHDYAYNQEVYNKNLYWGWLEITYPDIQDEAEKNNLALYQHDLMQEVAWLCMKKL